jgi:hypothetical protein
MAEEGHTANITITRTPSGPGCDATGLLDASSIELFHVAIPQLDLRHRGVLQPATHSGGHPILITQGYT